MPPMGSTTGLAFLPELCIQWYVNYVRVLRHQFFFISELLNVNINLIKNYHVMYMYRAEKISLYVVARMLQAN